MYSGYLRRYFYEKPAPLPPRWWHTPLDFVLLTIGMCVMLSIEFWKWAKTKRR